MNLRPFAIPILALVLLLGCSSPTEPDPPGAVRVTGTVQYFTFEGGFWAVRGDDGVTYDPLNGLPPEFQVQGLRVMMIVRVRNDLASIHMAGPIVEIVHIEVA